MRSVVKIAVALVAFVLSYAPLTASAQVTLPYSEGWENTMGGTYTAFQASLPGAPEWSYDNTITAEGRLRFDAGAGFANNGMFAATLDRVNFGGVQTNFLLGTLDMSNYNANNDVVLLSFATSNHGDENSANDRVWIRGSDADVFIEIVDLTALTAPDGVYENVTDLDISSVLLTNGQNFSATFQIRFGQEDNGNANSPTAIDGRSFDDIELALLPPNDVGATGVDAPGPNACGVSMTDVIVAVTNFGSAPQMMVPVQVMVSGAATATFNVTVPGPIAYGATEQVVAPRDCGKRAFVTRVVDQRVVGDSDRDGVRQLQRPLVGVQR